jgi:4-nitrophenyl phosphatase
MAAAVALAAGRQPRVVGKPSQSFLDLILEEHCLERSRTAMVGDRLDTDVAFGAAGGLQTLLVLSGVTTAAEAAAAVAAAGPSAPTMVLSSVAPLAQAAGT